MAIAKSIMKLNHIESIVKVVNDVAGPGSVTITLNTDLLKSNEELNGEVPTVNVACVEASCAVTGEINLTRNGKVLMNIFENFEQFEFNWGGDPENNTHDIVVNFTNKGTIYIRLLKLKGYRPKFRPEQGVNLI